MKVLYHLWNAVLFTLSYFFYSYLAHHTTQWLYGKEAKASDMRHLWRFCRKKCDTSTVKVVLFGCVDSRLNGFGELFLHAYVFGLMRRMYGIHATFKTPKCAGPSVSKQSNPRRASVNRENLRETVEALHAQYIVIVGHEFCAGDPRSTEEQVVGIKEFGIDAAGAHPSAHVVAIMLYAQLFGWRPEIVHFTKCDSSLASVEVGSHENLLLQGTE